jgi:hypothetical protein
LKIINFRRFLVIKQPILALSSLCEVFYEVSLELIDVDIKPLPQIAHWVTNSSATHMSNADAILFACKQIYERFYMHASSKYMEMLTGVLKELKILASVPVRNSHFFLPIPQDGVSLSYCGNCSVQRQLHNRFMFVPQ